MPELRPPFWPSKLVLNLPDSQGVGGKYPKN
jgi:hypothetical protein